MERSYDALSNSEEVEARVSQGLKRRYYRLARGGRWYGGIATADCCGCNLRCVFCWSNYPRDHPEEAGRFYSPEKIFHALISCAEKKGYRRLRISGNEPTLARPHLLKLLELVEETDYLFILETNGILIDRDYADTLSHFNNVHVRVSLKGTNEDEFSLLTGALPDGFSRQFEALEHLCVAGVSVHPAVMLSFSTEEGLRTLRKELRKIDPGLESELEEEYLLLYPHVAKRLKKAGLKPLIAYDPSGRLRSERNNP